MNILFTVDNNYLTYLYTIINSIVINNKTKINFYLLHSNIDESDIINLESYVNQYGNTITCIQINNNMFDNAYVLPHISTTAYYRLLINDVLPNNVDRILYLDVDIIIDGNINEIYNIDMKDNFICAVQDRPESKRNNKKHLRRLSIESDHKYINSGVILFNLEKMRSDIDKKEYMKFLNQQLKKNLLCGDQDIINLFFRKKIIYLPEIYNYRPRLFFKFKFRKPIIIHYYGWMKPWNPKYCSEYKRKYYKYAENRIEEYSYFKSIIYKYKFILNESIIIIRNICKKISGKLSYL